MTSDPALAAFLANHPAYLQTSHIDALRQSDYARLDRANHTYLDYTGASLYSESQVEKHLDLLRAHIFGNPHSANPTSLAMTSLVESTRQKTLAYFNAQDDYHLVFTQNASGALKLIGESFPFEPGAHLLATCDNHNSVNGIREYARNKGAQVTYSPLTTPDLRLDIQTLHQNLAAHTTKEKLFAFPAQSNYSGVKHPLTCIQQAQQQGWRVLLDAAAFVPTNPLNLREVSPDFVSVSFYKMFGYPAGLGALLIKKSSLPILRRPWFAGGTVNFTTVQHQHHILSNGEAGFEDGTINYLAIPSISIGLDHLTQIGIESIRTRIHCLTSHILTGLTHLQHDNAQPLVKLHGPANTEMRGGTITFNLYDPDNKRLDYRRIEELAGQQNLSLRTGCFCNPGANESAEGLTHQDLLAGIELGPDLNLPNFVKLMDSNGTNKSAGAIRASLGIASNFHDAQKLIDFIATFRNRPRHTLGEVTVEDDTCRVIRDSS